MKRLNEMNGYTYLHDSVYVHVLSNNSNKNLNLKRVKILILNQSSDLIHKNTLRFSLLSNLTVHFEFFISQNFMIKLDESQLNCQAS